MALYEAKAGNQALSPDARAWLEELARTIDVDERIQSCSFSVENSFKRHGLTYHPNCEIHPF